MKKKKRLFQGENKVFVHSNTNKNKPKTNQKQTTKTTKQDLRVRWGGPKGHLSWPLNPSKEKQKQKQKSTQNPTTKTKETETKQKQN